MNQQPPLVVDLDGTLIVTDTLVESVLLLIRRRPAMLAVLPTWLAQGRARFKTRISEACKLPVDALPWRTEFIDWLQEQKRSGRRLVLATAANRRIADDVALQLGLFDLVLASDDATNLKGPMKLTAIHGAVGERFSYAGDSRADLAIWERATSAVLVDVSGGVAARVREMGMPIEKEFSSETSLTDTLRTWAKAIRVHQWVKNSLLFVPLLTSFTFTDHKRALPLAAIFLAFSLAASGTYILNDLWDLQSDRRHPRKRNRPFASGRLSIAQGLVVAGALLGAGLFIAGTVSTIGAALIAGYVVLTSAYSWTLKEYVIIDVLMLALLYTYRVMAGGLTIDVRLSPWLLAFSVFVFLSLALVKRCSELMSLQESGQLASHGRDYRVADLAVLWPLGIGAALCAVLVFGLFVGSPEAKATYGESMLLWLVGIGLIYWLSRMWIKTVRAEMHDDPIVFAFRDRSSLVAIVAMGLIPILARLAR